MNKEGGSLGVGGKIVEGEWGGVVKGYRREGGMELYSGGGNVEYVKGDGKE